jgi:hypothetical protein
MNAYFLNISPYDYYGLCNQLYSIVGTCSYCYDNKIPLIFLNKFLKEIKTQEYCNISEIIDLPVTNEYLKKYNLYLVDYNNFTFDIVSAVYGDKNINVNVKPHILKYFNDNVLNIPKDLELHTLNGDPALISKKIYNKTIIPKLYITFKINDYTFTIEYTRPINLKYVSFQNSKRYNDGTELFVYVLRNLKFHNNYVSLADEFVRGNIDLNEKINCIHLRLEDDAITHWAKENKINKDDYKKILENKYINTIKKFIDKKDTTIILSHNYQNDVIDYLTTNGYNYVLTPKMNTFRDISAIIDMHIGQYCNGVYISVFESSYSFALLTRIYNKKNYKMVLLEFNNLSQSAESTMTCGVH